MATIRVTNQAEFLSALKTAAAGDTILLADANYGNVEIKNDYTSAVTIKAENALGAEFEALSLVGATNVSLDGLHTNGGLAVKSMSSGISVLNCDIDSVFYCRDVDGLKIDNVDVSGGQFGLLLNSVQNFSVTNSYIHEATEDLMRITGNSYNGVVENNVIADTTGGKPLHPDLLQFFGANGYTPHDITIRGNLMYDEAVVGQNAAQGIFLSDPNTSGGYKNILIEENMIKVNSPNSIYINGGQENVVVKDNVLMPGVGDGGAMIRLVGKAGLDNSGTTVDGNITKLIVDETKASTMGDNYVYGRDADLSKLFSGTDYTNWESYVPVEGSPIDFGSNYGPQTFLMEALSEIAGVSVEEGALPPLALLVEDTPKLIYSNDDVIELRGWGNDYRSDAHTSAMEVDQGTISLTFNADQVKWDRGLLSKDSAGTGDAVSAWIHNGVLKVSVQDGEQTVVICKDGIVAHRDYDLTITFDEEKVQVWLDDALVGQADMDLDLSQNNQAMIVGAYNANSQAGTTDAIRSMFDGTITDVAMYDRAMTPEQLAALDDVHHATSLAASSEVAGFTAETLGYQLSI